MGQRKDSSHSRRKSNRKNLRQQVEWPDRRLQVDPVVRTLCGCRSLSAEVQQAFLVCPLGFPWLCGGVLAAEAGLPPACNTGVSSDEGEGITGTHPEGLELHS